MKQAAERNRRAVRGDYDTPQPAAPAPARPSQEGLLSPAALSPPLSREPSPSPRQPSGGLGVDPTAEERYSVAAAHCHAVRSSSASSTGIWQELTTQSTVEAMQGRSAFRPHKAKGCETMVANSVVHTLDAILQETDLGRDASSSGAQPPADHRTAPPLQTPLPPLFKAPLTPTLSASFTSSFQASVSSSLQTTFSASFSPNFQATFPT